MTLLNNCKHQIYQCFLWLNNVSDQIFTVFFVEKLTVSKDYFLLDLQIVQWRLVWQ